MSEDFYKICRDNVNFLLTMTKLNENLISMISEKIRDSIFSSSIDKFLEQCEQKREQRQHFMLPFTYIPRHKYKYEYTFSDSN